ncbi:helix-turn-helix domain-containing protein [Streptomyces sp. NPDC007126]|uniref:helix-turn-helix domain-containing protein n=1 Tax=Streptomyces sp. NPDC007126 TaxID=3364774 RepID=UPI0036B633D1
MDDGTAAHGDAPTSTRTLAQKIDYLFKTAPVDGRSPSHEKVATAINMAAGERTISATYVWQLRTGRKANPTKRHLEALAKYFGVSPAYFLDEAEAQHIEEQLALLKALRGADVQALALRASALSESSRRSIAALVNQLRELEGLDGTGTVPRQPDTPT